jgi:hypothetical protein
MALILCFLGPTNYIAGPNKWQLKQPDSLEKWLILGSDKGKYKKNLSHLYQMKESQNNMDT